MRALGVVIAAGLVLAAPAASAVGGLRGVVTRGPTRPVCVAELPCSAPAKGVRIIFARSSATRSVTTDSHGRYRIALAPGTWTIRIEAGRFGYRPRTVVVPAARVGVRNIQIDTGIR